jgi:glucose/mannose transport system permease protein
MTAETVPLSVTAEPRARRLRWLTHNLAAKIATLPMIVTALVVFVGGAAWTVFYSFTSSKSLPVLKFVGMAQYDRLFTTARWYQAMQNVVIFGVMSMTLSLLFGFILAALLDQKIRFENTLRTIYLHPFAMSRVSSGSGFSIRSTASRRSRMTSA